MKKRLLICLCIILSAVLLCSCGGTKTEVFGSRGTSAYVKTGNYKNIVIDPESQDYNEYYNALMLGDFSNAGLYDRADDGAVKFGDYANIDFMGTLDGVAFDGGTDQGYDLLIGSGSFIDGFEDGLIGVSVGETVDLHLKFPESYDNEDLAGKAVIFNVTVNYRMVPQDISVAYKELGYKSVEEYEEKLNERCVQFFAVKNYVDSCTFKETPKKDNFTGLVMLVFYDNYLLSANGTDIETYLKSTNQKMNDFAGNVVDHLAEGQLDGLDEIVSVKNTVLAFYSLFEAENLKIDKEMLGKSTGYERCYKEYKQVKAACIEYVFGNAKLKSDNDKDK